MISTLSSGDAQPKPAIPLGLLIPAHRPPSDLVSLVQELVAREIFAVVIVVDDGSGPEFHGIFDTLRALPRVEVLTHAVNLGKGAALKTGFNTILAGHSFVAGVVTADADGQHATDDIVNVAQQLVADPRRLVLGVRSFGAGTPLRSRFGNEATRFVFRFLIGQAFADTQTGLRAVPFYLVPDLMRLSSERYEFEMDMLVLAARTGIPIHEVPIRTIYIAGNKESHFQPFYDSFRIYFLLFRFALASLVSTLVDVGVFLTVLSSSGSLAGSHLAGRGVSAVLNFVLVSTYVFRSGADWPLHLVKFALWVPVLGGLSFWLQATVQEATGWPAIATKVLVETALFVVNFLVQRDVIFVPSRRREP